MSRDTALLIIDVQCGIFSDFGPVYQSNAVLSRIRKLIARARAAAVPVIYVQHCSAPGESLDRGTKGWQIHPAVAPLKGERILEKRTPDCFQGTRLQRELKSLGIKTLIITGLQTEFCVDTACRRAFSLGYKVILARDAHSTLDGDKLSASEIIEHHNNLLGTWFVQLKEADQIAFGKSASLQDSRRLS
jgi:nicotinamidase-related amidase